MSFLPSLKGEPLPMGIPTAIPLDLNQEANVRQMMHHLMLRLNPKIHVSMTGGEMKQIKK